MDKETQYRELVLMRKMCNVCGPLGLTNPANVQGGILDSAEIGPWTRWNGDLDARVMVVGQEWGDVASFVRQQGSDNASPTNLMMRKLLGSIGIEIAVAPTRSPDAPVFLTNAALCLKLGGAQAPVKKEWFDNCAMQFLRQQIELVAPDVVVTLGERAFLAARKAFSLPRISFRRAVSQSFIPLFDGTGLVPVYHPARRVLNTARAEEQQLADWQRVKEALGPVRRGSRQRGASARPQQPADMPCATTGCSPGSRSSKPPSKEAGSASPHTSIRSFRPEKAMGNVKSIEQAVEALPPSELAEFRRWFAEFDAVAWDAQIALDAAAGKLDKLASEALADYQSGPASEP